jgi:3-oxoacyl-[acyl-carrier-protein] synthase II
MNHGNDVVVTGVGVVSCVGPSMVALREAALNGKSGISTITEFDTSGLPVKIGGFARGYDPALVLDPKELRLAPRIVQLAMGAALEATGSDAPNAIGDPMRIGTIVGTSVGGLDVIAEQMETLQRKGPRRVSPFSVPQLMDNAAAAWIALRWGFRGPAYSLSTACASSLDAIGLAYDLIRTGRLDACLAGGADAPVMPFMLASFAKANLLSRQAEEPEMASRPFDLHRDGFVFGEGAGLLLLERADRAHKRSAKVWARLCGYGYSSSPQEDLMEAPPNGEGIGRAMVFAMEQARIAPKDVGYISAHATGSRRGDTSEATAIGAVFGAHTETVPVGATKSLTGYTLAASGGISAAAALLAVGEGLMVPAATLRTPDPACPIHVLKNARRERASYALANGVGFGGHNACVVFGAP